MFNSFQRISKSDWLQKIEKDLRGKSISDLDFETGGLKLSPFFHKDQTGLPAPISQSRQWEIGEDIRVEVDFNRSNKLLLNALEQGVHAPRLIIEKKISYSQLAILLDQVELTMISIQFCIINTDVPPDDLLAHFMKYVAKSEIDWSTIHGGLEMPFLNTHQIADLEQLKKMIPRNSGNFKLFTIGKPSFYKEEDAIHELVELISQGESILNNLGQGGISHEVLNGLIQFNVNIGKDYFLQIAKIRALKLLWANVLKAYEVTGELPPISVQFAQESQTTDANTNKIAATTMAMSAVLGGADRLIIPPSSKEKTNLKFSNRIARNIQHLLKMESYLDDVVDPVSGSYFMEDLTSQLSEKAWQEFKNRA